jgi:Rrf2 family protein
MNIISCFDDNNYYTEGVDFMALSTTTDYALRIILCLASHPEEKHVSGRIISDEMRIPYNYFLKIVPKLKDAGLLISHQGKLGGFELSKDPKEITLYEVIRAMDDRFACNRCLIDSAHCNRDAVGACKAHEAFKKLQSGVDSYLKDVIIEDLV